MKLNEATNKLVKVHDSTGFSPENLYTVYSIYNGKLYLTQYVSYNEKQFLEYNPQTNKFTDLTTDVDLEPNSGYLSIDAGFLATNNHIYYVVAFSGSNSGRRLHSFNLDTKEVTEMSDTNMHPDTYVTPFNKLLFRHGDHLYFQATTDTSNGIRMHKLNLEDNSLSLVFSISEGNGDLIQSFLVNGDVMYFTHRYTLIGQKCTQ
jgi:hypothetical protein